MLWKNKSHCYYNENLYFCFLFLIFFFCFYCPPVYNNNNNNNNYCNYLDAFWYLMVVGSARWPLDGARLLKSGLCPISEKWLPKVNRNYQQSHGLTSGVHSDNLHSRLRADTHTEPSFIRRFYCVSENPFLFCCSSVFLTPITITGSPSVVPGTVSVMVILCLASYSTAQTNFYVAAAGAARLQRTTTWSEVKRSPQTHNTNTYHEPQWGL